MLFYTFLVPKAIVKNYFKYSALLFEKKVANPLYDSQGVKTGQHVIQHDADSMGQLFAGFYGERLQDIEKAEQQKSGGIKGDRVGQKPETDQLAGYFIDDALARVLFLEMALAGLGGRDADYKNKCCSQRQNGERPIRGREEKDDQGDDQ
jgi:hypothetical protein